MRWPHTGELPEQDPASVRQPTLPQFAEANVLQLVLGTHWHGPLDEEDVVELDENRGALELLAALEAVELELLDGCEEDGAGEEEETAALEEARDEEPAELDARDDDVTAALEDARLEAPREEDPDPAEALVAVEVPCEEAGVPEEVIPPEPPAAPSWHVPLLHTAPGSQSALVSHVVFTTHAVVPAHTTNAASQRSQVRTKTHTSVLNPA